MPRDIQPSRHRSVRYLLLTIGWLSVALGVIGIFLPVLAEYLRTGLVPRLPTAVLSTGLVLLSFLSFVCGLVLDTVTRGRKEAKRIAYLSVPGPAFHPDALGSGRGA